MLKVYKFRSSIVCLIFQIFFPESEEALANPDCAATNLLDFVAFKCGWKSEDSKDSKLFFLMKSHIISVKSA